MKQKVDESHLVEVFERPGLRECEEALAELSREMNMKSKEEVNLNFCEIDQALEALPKDSDQAEKAANLLKRWAKTSLSLHGVVEALERGAAVAKYMGKTPFASDGPVMAVAFLSEAHKVGGLPASLVETAVSQDAASLLTSLNSLEHLTELQRNRWDGDDECTWKEEKSEKKLSVNKNDEINLLEKCRLPLSHAANLQQMLVALATDFRALPILLVRRLVALKEEEDSEISLGRDALDVYAPLAERFGLYGLKTDLEDAGFMKIAPETRSRVVKALEATRQDFETVLSDVSNTLRRDLQEDDILMNQISSLRVSHRRKAPWSVWRKQKKLRKKRIQGELVQGVHQPYMTENEEHDDILYPLDTIALRIILDPVYNNDPEIMRAQGEDLARRALKLVHRTWPAVPNRVKDYIQDPKPNGYQSLHTTVMMRLHGVSYPFEVQIRTKEMHEVAEFGSAAHVLYSTGHQQQDIVPQRQEKMPPSSQTLLPSSPPPFRSILAAARSTRRHFHRARAILAKLNDEKHDHLIVEQQQEKSQDIPSRTNPQRSLDASDTVTSLTSLGAKAQRLNLPSKAPFNVRETLDDDGVAAMTGAQIGAALGKRLRDEHVFVLETGGRIITVNARSTALDVLDALERDLADSDHQKSKVTTESSSSIMQPSTAV